MIAWINGLGTAVPPFAVAQDRLCRLAATRCGDTPRRRAVIERLHARTGVDRRGSCLARAADDDLAWFYDAASPRGPTTAARMTQFERHAAPLATAAGQRALETAGLPAASMTHLVCVTCTGFAAPFVEGQIIAGLGLSPHVQRLHVGFMGCHGALNGLQMARAIVGSRAGARVLLVAVELCSLHFQSGWHADRIVPNALFADGAAAAVVTDIPRGFAIEHTASRIVPETAEEMTWRIGDHGFEMHLSPRVPRQLAAALRPWLDEQLAVAGATVASIDRWAIHAGGPRIVAAVAERLGLGDRDVAVSRDTLTRHGNMSSATVLFILDQLDGGGPCVALGFGPGLAVEALVLRREHERTRA